MPGDWLCFEAFFGYLERIRPVPLLRLNDVGGRAAFRIPKESRGLTGRDGCLARARGEGIVLFPRPRALGGCIHRSEARSWTRMTLERRKRPLGDERRKPFGKEQS